MSVRTAALLIDDDGRLAELVTEYLGQHAIDVTVTADGKRGIAALRAGRFDVVLLDVMLPGWDGFETCRRIRAAPEIAAVPIVMLTAKGDDVDRIVGLELGADDYLPKPFNPRELLARIRAVLRRATPSLTARPRFRTGGLEIDFDAREVIVEGRRAVLTHYEFELLSVLARAPGRVLSRDQFLDAMKGRASEPFDRSIDVHISNLRAKIEADPKAPRYIKTVRGAGYVLVRGAWVGRMRLHSRIYLHSLIVLIIACLTTAAVFAFNARGMFMHGIPERAARHFASLVAEHFDDPALLQRQLDRFHTTLEVDVTVRDLTGRIVAGSGRELPPLNAEEADRVLRGGARVRARPVWQAAVSVLDPASGAVVGILQASMQRLAAPALARPILGVMFVLLVVAVITLPTARRIARPLRRLTEAATRLGSGDLSARVPVAQAGHGRSWWRGGRRDELRGLASSFNEMADRVERLVRSQRVLLANVSHELRSPLTRIRMAMDLLPADIRDGAKLRGVENDLSDLDRLIEDILTTARLDETGLPTRLDTFDARRILTDVAERAQHDPIIDGRAIQVAPGPPVTLCADEALLRRAVWNLVENAAKYGAPPISLAARSEGDRVAFSVSDDGPGIPATDRERVFAPFYRGERARTPGGHRGVGLGLTLARRIAEVHGGTIAVAAASGGDEHGCQVVITLPARPPA